MKDLKKTVSKNIIYLRTQNKLTQFELGEKLNYSDKTISKWERGESIPDAYILKKMSKIFNVSVDYILTEHPIEEKADKLPIHDNHITITKISIVGVFTVAFLVFIVLWLLGRVEWLVFAFIVPISLIVFLVLNSIWKMKKVNFYIISALVWSILGCIYLSLLQNNIWQIFLLGIPCEMIVYLCFKIKLKPKS